MVTVEEFEANRDVYKIDVDYYTRNLFDKACARLLFTFGLPLSFFRRGLFSKYAKQGRDYYTTIRKSTVCVFCVINRK